MLKNIKTIMAALVYMAGAYLLGAQMALAGQRTQIAGTIGCIKTIVSGNPILSGIPTGKLPATLLVRRCGGLTLSINLRGGLLRSTPVQNRFIPRYIPRGKGLATPDARLTLDPGFIHEAWLTRPTERYDHGILGDTFEADAFAVILANKRRLEYFAGKDSVFEDRMVRLVDLDGDGKKEMVVIHTYLDRGAAIAVYAVRGDKIIRLAESQPIGQPHRWLNPVAAADFDGDGKIELAWVETPHIGGTLKVARLTGTGDK
ncbi:MAG TPA: VCBS repeat-containing protein, partial [Rhizobiales bacterium]|nr:VCBS repeat-containing protein [Hyphomicrobiales bacterium]